MPLKPETVESIKLYNWIRAQPELEPYVFHIPNERLTTPQHGRTLRRMGVKSGVSDYFIGIPCGIFHGLFLELKAGKNKPSLAQQQFLDNMTAKGYMCSCVWGFESAKHVIEHYLAAHDNNASLPA